MIHIFWTFLTKKDFHFCTFSKKLFNPPFLDIWLYSVIFIPLNPLLRFTSPTLHTGCWVRSTKVNQLGNYITFSPSSPFPRFLPCPPPPLLPATVQVAIPQRGGSALLRIKVRKVSYKYVFKPCFLDMITKNNSFKQSPSSLIP